MLAMAKHAFAINPSPQLKEIAVASGWRMYQPEATEMR
jgi:phosphoserine phosphatase